MKITLIGKKDLMNWEQKVYRRIKVHQEVNRVIVLFCVPPLQGQPSHRDRLVRATSSFCCTDSRIQSPFVPPLSLPTYNQTKKER